MNALRRLLCSLRGHRLPLQVELGRVFHFVAFRCTRCKAHWFVAWGD